MNIKIFNKNIGYNPIFFSYPFGEYSLEHEKYISSKFDFAFGQHSGIIDINKEKYELPRFPINEKYGELKRFKSIINSFPLEYKKLLPLEKKLTKKNNPPEFKVEFFKEQKNLKKTLIHQLKYLLKILDIILYFFLIHLANII